MPYLRSSPGFTKELFSFSIGQLLFPWDLDGNLTIQFRIVGFPDSSKPSYTGPFDQLEMGEFLPFSVVRGR